MDLEYYKKEFKRLAKVDSDFRNSPDIFEKTEEDFREVDSVSTKLLKRFINEHGFPSEKLLGYENAFNAWLFAQHADLDLEFQKEFLKLMEKDNNPKFVKYKAMLIDRILRAQGLPQRFGSQVYLKDGKWVTGEIEDKENIDKLRKENGFSDTLEEYVNSFNE